MDELEIFFKDQTINEASCFRSVVVELINNDMSVNEWMIESELGISSDLEESYGVIQFWKNGEAILKEFQSGFMDEIVPTDAIFLRDFIIDHGWDFVLSEELVEFGREYWDKFFSIIDEDNAEYDEDEYTDEDFYGDDENFLEYENNMKEYRKPTANKYNILNLREFANHGYDLDKRKEKEENRKF